MAAMEGKCQQIAHELMRFVTTAGEEREKETAVKADLESLEKAAGKKFSSAEEKKILNKINRNKK
jgi:hypothetical protein